MSTTISDGDTTLHPTVVDGWEASREGQNIVHPILGRANPDVTIRPAMLRNGTLRLVFPLEADAAEAVDLHGDASTLTLASTDRDYLDMTYVVAGRVRLILDDTTRDVWVVEVDYQEVSE